MEKNNIPEEVTITPVIRDLERLGNKLFSFIVSLFRSIGSAFLKFVFFCIKNLKFLFVFTLIGVLLGFLSFFIVPRTFSSTLVLELNIDTKSQLYNDINYFDALIEREKYEQISTILNLSEEEASTLTGIKIIPFSSKIEKLQIIDAFYRNLDTTTKRTLDFNEIYLDEFDELSTKFAIDVFGTDETVFAKLEDSFVSYLERILNLRERRMNTKETLIFQKELLMKQLKDLDTLKKITNESILKKAENNNGNSLQSFGMLPREQSSGFNPLDIYDKYLQITNQILSIDGRLMNLESNYKIDAHFNKFGSKRGFGKLKRSVFAGSTFFLLGVLLIALKSIPKPE